MPTINTITNFVSKTPFLIGAAAVLGSWILAMTINNEAGAVTLLACIAYLATACYAAYAIGRERAIDRFGAHIDAQPDVQPALQDLSAQVDALSQQLTHEREVVAALTENLRPDHA